MNTIVMMMPLAITPKDHGNVFAITVTKETVWTVMVSYKTST